MLLAEIRGLHAPVGADGGRLAAGDHGAVDHHRQVVGQREDGVDVVFDQHHGVVGFQAQQQLDHALGLGHAHAGQRLVKQQHLRIGGQRHGDLQLPLLAVAGGTRDEVAARCQAGQFQRFFSALVHGRITARALQPAQWVEGLLRGARLRGQAHVFPHGEGQEDVGLLVAAAETAARDLLGRGAGDVVRAEGNGAAGRRQIARQQVGQRRLAGAVGADDAVDALAPQIDRHIVDGGQAAELLGQVPGAEEHFTHARPPCAP